MRKILKSKFSLKEKGCEVELTCCVCLIKHIKDTVSVGIDQHLGQLSVVNRVCARVSVCVCGLVGLCMFVLEWKEKVRNEKISKETGSVAKLRCCRREILAVL